jgi:tetraacyldisaccharide 4'-kinase
MQFGDHHIFTIDDFKDIQKRFDSLQAPKKVILTTEKDAMRLMKFATEINGMPFYVLPIAHQFLFNGTEAFMGTVVHFIKDFKKPGS